jgi:hypothetical protein
MNGALFAVSAATLAIFRHLVSGICATIRGGEKTVRDNHAAICLCGYQKGPRGSTGVLRKVPKKGRVFVGKSTPAETGVLVYKSVTKT